MGFFSLGQILGMFTGRYPCPCCGTKMKWEDDSEETLICPKCGHEEDSDHYGFTDEEYDALYPTKEDVGGYEESNDEYNGESYEEVYNELDDD